MSGPRWIAATDLDLSEFIRPGDRIVVGQAAGEPVTLTEALVAQRAAILDPGCAQSSTNTWVGDEAWRWPTLC